MIYSEVVSALVVTLLTSPFSGSISNVKHKNNGNVVIAIILVSFSTTKHPIKAHL